MIDASKRYGIIAQETAMPKKRPDTSNGRFGERLAKLRKEAGYSQRELAEKLGISNRVVAYYEGETDHPPASLLVDLCRALGVSADELLGIKPVKQKAPPRDPRLWRRVRQIEKLPSKERRYLFHVIDNFLKGTALPEK